MKNKIIKLKIKTKNPHTSTLFFPPPFTFENLPQEFKVNGVLKYISYIPNRISGQQSYNKLKKIYHLIYNHLKQNK